MRVRNLTVVGLGVAALALSTMAVPASATSGAGVASHLASAGKAAAVTSTAPATTPAAIKCGQSFGTPTGTPDGIIAWNDTSGSGYDTADAVAVSCTGGKKKRTIKKVSFKGYFGSTPTETYNINFYGNSPSNEPDDSNVLCSYQQTGAGGGSYPTDAQTDITLTSKCKLPKGISWVAIQNFDASQPYYWEVQNEPNSGGILPDWRDVNDLFGSGCRSFSNTRYLIDCLGYDYLGFMLQLK